MPGYIIHIAVAKEYAKKHKIKNVDDFIRGSIAPDFANDKSTTHYGKSPAYTNLGNYLKENTILTDYDKGFFLHLITDYLFYNKYLNDISKPQIYYDYDFLNKEIIDKYEIVPLEEIKDKIFFKEGVPKHISMELVDQMVNDISNMDIDTIVKEVEKEDKKWNEYKKIVMTSNKFQT